MQLIQNLDIFFMFNEVIPIFRIKAKLIYK